MRQEKEVLPELFEEKEEIQKKAKQMAELIRNSKHFIIFTGAGISTSTGIRDYRGPQGVWTLMDKGQMNVNDKHKEKERALRAIASKTHMAIAKLLEMGYCKYVISQNTDGQHRRSGIPPNKISELHGNINVENCSKCGQKYTRDFRTRESTTKSRVTSRKCVVEGCGGVLHDNIVGFGSELPKEAMNLGFQHAKDADLCLAMGSSLTVTPACNMTKIVGKKKGNVGDSKLVIVNLQETPLDHLCTLRVHSKCDEFMELVMKELDLEIPPFILQRRCQIKKLSEHKLLLEGVDVDDTPHDFIKQVEVISSKGSTKLEAAPFYIETAGEDTKVVLHFRGYYNEPPLTLLEKAQVNQFSSEKPTLFVLKLDPHKSEWNIQH